MQQAPVAALRKFVRPREAEERYLRRCDAPDQTHQFNPLTRRVRFACESCAILYRTVYREIPRHIRALPDFRMTDAQWEELAIPISLAFFSYSTPADRIVALYPGPAGATESARRGSAAGESYRRGARVFPRPD